MKSLKNIENNQKVNNNDENKIINDERELSSVKSESSKKHQLEMMNLKGVFILGYAYIFWFRFEKVLWKYCVCRRREYWLQITLKRN